MLAFAVQPKGPAADLTVSPPQLELGGIGAPPLRLLPIEKHTRFVFRGSSHGVAVFSTPAVGELTKEEGDDLRSLRAGAECSKVAERRRARSLDPGPSAAEYERFGITEASNLAQVGAPVANYDWSKVVRLLSDKARSINELGLQTQRVWEELAIPVTQRVYPYSGRLCFDLRFDGAAESVLRAEFQVGGGRVDTIFFYPKEAAKP